jgi:hypothetical protein
MMPRITKTNYSVSDKAGKTSGRKPNVPLGDELPVKVRSEEQLEQQRKEVRAELDTSLKHCISEAPNEPPTPAAIEDFLRTFTSLAVALSSMPAEEVDSDDEDWPAAIDVPMGAVCDGSRLPQVRHLAVRITDPLAFEPDILGEVSLDLKELGVAGEENATQTVYLIATSRLLSQPLHAIVQGASGAGKSFIVEKTKLLIPPEAVVDATSITPKALFNLPPGFLRNKVLVCGERSRKTDDEAAEETSPRRQLQSEGKLTRLTTVKEGDKFVTRQQVQEGPMASIETTTLSRGKIFAEDLNRCIVIQPDDSAEQTRRVMKATANQYARNRAADELAAARVIEKHRRFQRMLRPAVVVIPFAAKIAECLPAHKPEIRRLISQVFRLMAANAFLHQFSRGVNHNGEIEATVADYEIARRLLTRSLGESIGVDPADKEAFDKLKVKFQHEPFTTAQASKEFSSTERNVRKYLASLASLGCVQRTTVGKRGAPAQWLIVADITEVSLLPPAEALLSDN